MTINTTSKEKPTGSANSTAGTINDLDFPTGQRPRKAFETLRAAFAIQGHALHRTDPTDGPVTYWAERWGQVRNLSTLDDTLEFLKQIGGRA